MLTFEIIWRDLEQFGAYGVSVVGKEPAGLIGRCKQCGYIVERDLPTPQETEDSAAASIEAWEWWKAQEAHGNDIEEDDDWWDDEAVREFNDGRALEWYKHEQQNVGMDDYDGRWDDDYETFGEDDDGQ